MATIIVPETPTKSMSELSDLEYQVECEMFDNKILTDVRSTLTTTLINELKATINSMSDEIECLKDDVRQKNETIKFFIEQNKFDLPASQQLRLMENDIKDLFNEKNHMYELLSFFLNQLNGRKSFHLVQVLNTVT